jgi:hypothetical protein
VFSYSKSDASSKARVFIGRHSGGAIQFFKGSIDDVRIYNRGLSAEEVKALYDLEKPKAK